MHTETVIAGNKAVWGELCDTQQYGGAAVNRQYNGQLRVEPDTCAQLFRGCAHGCHPRQQ